MTAIAITMTIKTETLLNDYQEGYDKAIIDLAHNVNVSNVLGTVTKENTTLIREGFYRHPYYFCVYTYDQTPEEITETTYHELAHYYIMTYEEHFEINATKEMYEVKE